MAYESIGLETDLRIEEIFSIHYFEYRSDFYFAGERHDFWEFQCVDKGEVEICTDDGPHKLTAGQVIFHRPNEFHTLSASGNSAPNLVVVSFSCHSPCMQFFEKRILTLSETERSLMGMLIAEARQCIASPLDDPYLEKMEKRKDSMFGSQQMIRLHLEEFLISLIRRYTIPQLSLQTEYTGIKPHSPVYNKIIFYLEKHIRQYVTIEQICHDNLIGRSQLQKMFRTEHNCGVIEYFSKMKIETAKQLIRENQMNFTQISDFLGYSSIHYFSRQFKKITRMTPSEYASSIKARSERTV
jgi:AraC-like DNA-binding protein